MVQERSDALTRRGRGAGVAALRSGERCLISLGQAGCCCIRVRERRVAGTYSRVFWSGGGSILRVWTIRSTFLKLKWANGEASIGIWGMQEFPLGGTLAVCPYLGVKKDRIGGVEKLRPDKALVNFFINPKVKFFWRKS